MARALNGENTDKRTTVHKTLKEMWDKNQKKVNDIKNKQIALSFKTVTRIPWPPCFEAEYRERVLQSPHTGKKPPNVLEILDPWETDGKPWMPKYVRSLESYKRYTNREAWEHLVRDHGIKRAAKQWQEQFEFVLLPIEQLKNEPKRKSYLNAEEMLAKVAKQEQDSKKK